MNVNTLNVELKQKCFTEMMFICVTLLVISGITGSTSEQYDVVGPAALLAVSGEDVILPCSVKPSISAVDMRVEWFRPDLKDSVVHLYEDHEDRNTDQLQSYRGRTELFKEELQTGNTSLKLSRVQISDEGVYRCFVQSRSWYDDITVDVRVEAVGSHPLITIDGFDVSGGLQLQCESRGWNPEPDLVWLDSEGVTLRSETTDTHRDTDGFRVKHKITVYNSDSKYHCRVIMRHHMLETEIITSSKMFHSWKTLMILISVGVLIIVIAGILTAVFIYKNRELQNKKISNDARIQSEDQRIQSEDQRIKRENQKIQIEKQKIQQEDQRIKSEDQKIQSVKQRIQSEYQRIQSEKSRKEVITHFRKSAVNVTLDPDSAHPHLIVSHDGKKVRYKKQSETVKDRDEDANDKFDDVPCVLGKEGFSSDFYYEVQVKGLNAWYVGVARESVNRKGLIRLSPLNGYWTVGLENGAYLACDDPCINLSLTRKPQRLGVFVDYKEGQVHFYDVESMCHIFSYIGLSFNEKLCTFFSFVHFAYGLENSPPFIICTEFTKNQNTIKKIK